MTPVGESGSGVGLSCSLVWDIMNKTVGLLDVVALVNDIPQCNLCRGQVGTVVEVLAEGAAFEVEFADQNGRTYESLGLRPEQIMVLHFEP